LARRTTTSRIRTSSWLEPRHGCSSTTKRSGAFKKLSNTIGAPVLKWDKRPASKQWGTSRCGGRITGRRGGGTRRRCRSTTRRDPYWARPTACGAWGHRAAEIGPRGGAAAVRGGAAALPPGGIRIGRGQLHQELGGHRAGAV